jgi:hypothetical protein
VLLWTLPYLGVALLALLRPRATTAGMLLPLLLLWVANRSGWHFSLAFAVVLLTLVAIVGLPRDLPVAVRALVGTLAIGQAVIAWLTWPMPALRDDDLAARTVATALASAPDRSVLIDDRFAPLLLKWAPSLEPYLTTRDTGFELAVAQPMVTVRYVLVTADAEGLTLDADRRPPAGFVRAWSWRGYTLWRHPDAVAPPLAFDALARETP